MNRRVRWIGALAAAGFAALLAGCLLDHTLISPQNAYDPRLALAGDSLGRFDSVEILLKDPGDPDVSIVLWKGPLASAEGLPPHLAGDGQTLVYVVNGYRTGKGACFSERVSQTGGISVLWDSCKTAPVPDSPTVIVPDPDGGKKPDPVVDPVPDPKPAPRPGFLRDTLAYGLEQNVIFVTIDSITGGVEGDFTLRASEPWIRAEPDSFHADKDAEAKVSVDREGLEAGVHQGRLILSSAKGALDTAYVSATVPKPVVLLQGTLVDWRDSLPLPDYAVTLDGAEPGSLSDGKGGFTFADVDLGPHTLRAMSNGRLGGIDTFTLAAKGTVRLTLTLAPKGSFRAVDAGWGHGAGHATIAGGYGVLLSSDFGEAGSVMAFPLDNRSPALQRFFPQGNSDGDPDFPEYFEPGEIVGDGLALFIAYPDDARLARIGNWKSSPQNASISLPFQPGSLMLDGPHLLILGRLADSTLVLGDYNAADLSLNRIDTLAGQYWDGALVSRRTPKLAVWGDAYFAVDGNSPNAKGHILRIGRNSRRVEASRELPDASINGLAIYDGMIYVTSMSSSGKLIRILDAGLSETGAIAAGANTNRIAFASEGALRGYGFVTTDGSAVLVIHPLSKKPVGTLEFPGNQPGRSLSVDGRTGSVLVSDSDNLYSAEF